MLNEGQNKIIGEGKQENYWMRILTPDKVLHTVYQAVVWGVNYKL